MRTLRGLSALVLLTLLPFMAFGITGERLTTSPLTAPAAGRINLPERDDGDEDSVYYEYGFEDGWSGWTTVDLTDPGLTWHSTDAHAIDGRSFWVGKDELGGYDDHWLQYLVTPSLNLAGRQNLRLTFNVLWAVEDPQNGAPDTSGITAGYDAWDGCNVWISTNNGESWQVIRPTRPAYNYQSLFSFGYEWRMGTNIPGWCGFSNGAQAAEFDLSRFAQNNVKIRWAFCTDPAWNTADDENAIGTVVDNLVVRDGNGVIWQNNGDALGDMTRAQGPVSGDHWELTEDDAHAGEFSARCPIEANLSNALVSPAIEIPAGGWYTYFDFWVRADARRSDSNGDNALDDFFEVQVSTDGLAWERIIYDYGRQDANGDLDPAWVDRFHYYGPDTTFRIDYPEWKRKLNLTQFAGQEIYLRWRVQTDDDVDGNQGSGIYIDDPRIMISERRENDVSIEWTWLKYPNAMGFTTPGRLAVSNLGMADQQRVTKYYQLDTNAPVAIVPWEGLAADSTKEYGFSITPNRILYADSTTVKVYVNAAADSTNGNDTITIKNVVFYPANIWRLGYDNRTYRLRSDFDRGTGPIIRFTPVEDNIRGSFDVKALRVRWNSAQGNQDVETRLHIYRDARGAVGAELYNAIITVGGDDILPNVHVIDLSGVQAVQGMSTNFWVWFEILGDDFFPQIVGDEPNFGAGHYFSYNGQNISAVEREWQAHAIIMPAGRASRGELTAGRTWLDYGDVAGGSTKRMRVALFNGGIGEVTVSSVVANDDRFAVEFAGPVTLKIGDMAHVYVTFNAQDGTPVSSTLTIESSDNSPPRIVLTANGGNSVDPAEAAPVVFGLGYAYPNPFNSATVIPFSLGSSVDARLAVYELSGRLVATLVDGRTEAGSYAVSFEAGSLATGVYLYRLDAGPFSSIRKVIVVK